MTPRRRSSWLFACLAAGACRAGAPPELGVAIPREEDWREIGVVLRAGPEGAWDRHLPGPSAPGPLVERDGELFLFYAGADGERSLDGGPRHRAIGVATSRDGVRFTKHARPVMVHAPTGGEEEGANSAAVSLAPGGSFAMHYGAATQIDAENIEADGRLATSADGFAFRDSGRVVLDHRSAALYGAGDEIFPIASYLHRGRWFVFYVPNGTPASRDLAVAWGPAPDQLEHSAVVVDASPQDPARVSGTIVHAANAQVLLFVQRGWHPNTRLEVRAAPAAAPWRRSEPLRVYSGPLFRESTNFVTVHLDRRRGTWLLYRSTFDGQIVLHTAALAARDATPPSAPRALAATAVGERVCLAWSAAEDLESGVGAYAISRDGAPLARTLETHVWDEPGPGRHVYQVRAANLHAEQGPAAEWTLAVAAELPAVPAAAPPACLPGAQPNAQ